MRNNLEETMKNLEKEIVSLINKIINDSDSRKTFLGHDCEEWNKLLDNDKDCEIMISKMINLYDFTFEITSVENAEDREKLEDLCRDFWRYICIKYKDNPRFKPDNNSFDTQITYAKMRKDASKSPEERAKTIKLEDEKRTGEYVGPDYIGHNTPLPNDYYNISNHPLHHDDEYDEAYGPYKNKR